MLSVKNLKKEYKLRKGKKFVALKSINLEFPNNGFVFIIGKSGSGKSTLLNILGGLDKFDEGEIIIKGKSSKDFKARDFDSYRNTYLGFVFQSFNLIETYTLAKNISLALELQSVKGKELKNKKIDEILESVGLLDKKYNKINELSGGQKQRVAIARALVKKPEIIIADEPTGNLDSETSKVVMDTLRDLSKEKLVIMVTHDVDFAAEYADRVIELKDGVVMKDETSMYRSLTPITSVDVESDVKKIIRVPKSRRIDMTVVDQINDVVKDNMENDIYVSLSFNKDVVNTITPKSNELTSMTTKVEEVKLNYDKKDDFKLIKSKLPILDILKMSFGNVWRKKFRLIFTFLLMSLAIFFFGQSSTFSGFDYGYSAAHTYDEIGYQFLKVNQFTEMGTVLDLYDDDEFDSLNSKYKDVEFSKRYEIYDEDSNISYSEKFIVENFYNDFDSHKGLIVLDNLNEMNIAYSDDSISDTNAIYISDFYAEILKNNLNLSSINDLIGETECGSTIKGIYSTNADRHESIHNQVYDLSQPMEGTDEVRELDENQIFDKKLLDNFKNWEGYRNYIFDYITLDETLVDNSERLSSGLLMPYISRISTYYNVNGSQNGAQDNTLDLIYFASEIEVYKDILNKDIKEIITLGENEVVIAEDEFHTSQIAIGDTISLEQIETLNNNNVSYHEDLTVVGYVNQYEFQNGDLNSNENNLIISNEQKFSLNIDEVGYGFNHLKTEVVFSLTSDLHKNGEMLNLFSDVNNLLFIDLNGAELHTLMYFSSLAVVSLTPVFARISYFMIALTAFLIFNSITASVLSKSKDIGTFRAIGARGSDVAKIFVFEALIIGLISTIVALFGVYQASGLINAQLAALLPFDLAIVRISTIIKMFLLSGFVSLIAAFIPSKAVATMRPIDAIKK